MMEKNVAELNSIIKELLETTSQLSFQLKLLDTSSIEQKLDDLIVAVNNLKKAIEDKQEK